MPVNRVVPPGSEPVEFRPLPGQEEDWAGSDYILRSQLWYWLGVYPIGAILVLILTFMGMVAV